MNKVQEMFKDKGIGFYVTGAVALLSIVSVIVCATTPFAQEESLNIVIAFLLTASIAAIILLIVPMVMPLFVKSDNVWYQLLLKTLNKISPWFLLGFSLLALLPLVSLIFTYISANATSKSAQDIVDMVVEKGIVVIMVFILLTVILSVAAVFIPFFKKTVKHATIKPIAETSEQGEMEYGK